MGSNRLVRGVNDFASVLPDAAAEWDYEKNGDLKPEDIMAGSDRYVFFRCRRGHEWRTKAYHRKEGHGCPVCSSVEGGIIPGRTDLASNRPELLEEWDYGKNVYVPENLGLYSKKKVWWRCRQGHSWQTEVFYRAVKGHGCPYCAGQILLAGFNDLETIMPQLAAEWNQERNGSLKPSDVMPGTDQKVWWRCRRGHEWEAYIYSRKAGTGCPYCSNQKLLKGFNDLATTAPWLAAEWDDARNGSLAPDMVTAGSCRSVHWICREGHRWEASIASRSGKQRKGCPFCAGVKVVRGRNDLESQAPEVAREWDQKRNEDCDPENVSVKSHRKAWWICPLGHSYQAKIANRANGDGCPYCAGKKVLRGFNDLKTVSPQLAAEWNQERNGSLTPEDVTRGSMRRVWWLCNRGHEWSATVCSRKRSGCPYCSNRKVLEGFNDLATVMPGIATEWNIQRNGDLEPTDVVFGSHKRVWWKCRRGHEWEATISSRSQGNGCPVCGYREDRHGVNNGINDLRTLSPQLCSEWDEERNGDLRPEMFRQFSNREVWWKCAQGHHWRAKIQGRQRGTGCPYCVGKYPARSRLI